MKIKVRKQGDKEWEERDVFILFEEEQQEALEGELCSFAEEWDLDEDAIIEVFRRGKYMISHRYVEVIYQVRPI